MNKSTNLDAIKNQINQIMEENKPSVVFNSKEDREIRELEQQITSSNLKEEFSVLISDLDEEKKDSPFGGSGFKRDQYALGWRHWGDGTFRLTLTNIPHKNSKVLIKTPESFKKDICPLLPTFTQLLSNKYKK